MPINIMKDNLLKITRVLNQSLLLFILFSGTTFAQSVEVTLIDKLDGNLSSYCFDIVGGGNNIDPNKGLQAHTCYSYRGELGADQAFDPAGIENGVFKLVDFDVCMTLLNTTADTKVSLETCNGSDQQKLTLGENGHISPLNAPSMCLTAGKNSVFGRNGTSPHQIKTLTLQSCEPELDAYQQWRTRTKAD